MSSFSLGANQTSFPCSVCCSGGGVVVFCGGVQTCHATTIPTGLIATVTLTASSACTNLAGSYNLTYRTDGTPGTLWSTASSDGLVCTQYPDPYNAGRYVYMSLGCIGAPNNWSATFIVDITGCTGGANCVATHNVASGYTEVPVDMKFFNYDMTGIFCEATPSPCTIDIHITQ